MHPNVTSTASADASGLGPRRSPVVSVHPGTDPKPRERNRPCANGTSPRSGKVTDFAAPAGRDDRRRTATLDMTSANKHRLPVLDGFCAPWPSHGSRCTTTPGTTPRPGRASISCPPRSGSRAWTSVALGRYGVYLFFMISGYVIALGLRDGTRLWQFGLRRIARLWPTLLACGLLTWTITGLLGPDALRRSAFEAGISMLFLPPMHVDGVFGMKGARWLDSVYWTLWVEVRFYACCALVFVLARRTWALPECVGRLRAGRLRVARGHARGRRPPMGGAGRVALRAVAALFRHRRPAERAGRPGFRSQVPRARAGARRVRGDRAVVRARRGRGSGLGRCVHRARAVLTPTPPVAGRPDRPDVLCRAEARSRALARGSTAGRRRPGELSDVPAASEHRFRDLPRRWPRRCRPPPPVRAPAFSHCALWIAVLAAITGFSLVFHARFERPIVRAGARLAAGRERSETVGARGPVSS